MNSGTQQQPTHSRRDVLQKSGAVSILLGLGLAAVPGSSAADKAELVEAMASEAGLSEADAGEALAALVDATTRALAEHNRVAVSGFGLFTVSQRVRNDRGERSDAASAVDFDACPAVAAALGLAPGNSGQRRSGDGSKCRAADVVIDADRIAAAARHDADRGLSKADAKRALDAFITATTKALNRGETVSVNEFGSFSISKRSARTGRNPQTGKEIQIAARNVVKFKAGAELSKA